MFAFFSHRSRIKSASSHVKRTNSSKAHGRGTVILAVFPSTFRNMKTELVVESLSWWRYVFRLFVSRSGTVWYGIYDSGMWRKPLRLSTD